MAKTYPGTPNDGAEEPADTPRFDVPGDGEPLDNAPEESKNRSLGSWAREILIIVAVALLLSFLIKTFLFRAFFIPSGSMEDTLEIDDRIFVNQLVPEPFALERGDVVVFRDTQGWLPEPAPGTTSTNWFQDALVFIGLLPDQSQQHLVKRVIGLEGDRVICCDAEGRITVNGEPLNEPYLYPGANPSDVPFDVTVPEGEIWVMGDHRNASADSRANQDGPGEGFIDVDDIEGKAAVIAWPLDRIGFLGNYPDVFAGVPEAPQSTGRENSAP
ncbi:signal peptidase I [Arthrobacter pigmenti]|uniref:Signal peptidase I n=1 Tax=Arthrobacter pigmenti TaxID=271432 RepID=A0A846RU26_9MICC|nr:signal peptidase I [Arthrobacter pigmenti]NJC22546.1 signal peptidase I [Arthrobacter pigmenti]